MIPITRKRRMGNKTDKEITPGTAPKAALSTKNRINIWILKE